jgi:uncharacterized protein YuzE
MASTGHAMAIAPNQIQIDEEADAAYVRLSDQPIARTREVADGIIVDISADDRIAGIEVLGVRSRVGRGDRLSYLSGLAEGLALRGVPTPAE